MEQKKREAEKEILKNQKDLVSMSSTSRNKTVGSNDIIKQINDLIAQQKLLIDFLELVNKNNSSLGFDVKNMIDLIKLNED